MQQTVQRAQRIKVVLSDVDGILTDGKVNFFLTQDGRVEEIKSFNTQDGIALLLARSAGLVCGIITGRRHPTTVERARNLGFKYLYQGFLSKMAPLQDVLKKEHMTAQEVCYIGDDITDLPLLQHVGFAATVPNAVDVVKEHAHLITRRTGGDGAFREVIDFILQAQGKLAPLTAQAQAGTWADIAKPEMEIITSQEGIK